MSSDYLRVVLFSIGELLVEYSANAGVQIDSFGAQQSAIGGILHQRVLKNVIRVRG